MMMVNDGRLVSSIAKAEVEASAIYFALPPFDILRITKVWMFANELGQEKHSFRRGAIWLTREIRVQVIKDNLVIRLGLALLHKFNTHMGERRAGVQSLAKGEKSQVLSGFREEVRRTDRQSGNGGKQRKALQNYILSNSVFNHGKNTVQVARVKSVSQ